MSDFSFSNTLDSFSFNELVDDSHISVDDSVFLQESLTSLTSSVNNDNTTTSSLKLTSKPKTYTQNSQRSLQLKDWGLPDVVLQKYKAKGLTQMFQWQADCLSNKNLLESNGNLIYSAPTSAGKTLVAEILAIKTVLERQKKVLFILPFVAVVREKMFYLQEILGGTGIRVEGYMGTHNPPGGFQKVQVAVCTIEKANGIINKVMEDGSLDDIGTVVVDELHLLGDPSRGYLLELMLTKLKYMSRKAGIRIQIIGMSATLPNLDLLGKWLDADLYQTEFRPIPLDENVLISKEIYTKNCELLRTLPSLPELETDTDNLLQLCLETIRESCSVLIFCPTKNWCDSLAQQIANAFWKLGRSGHGFGSILRRQLNPESINETLELLKRSPSGLDAVLRKTVSFGVAFHHAGLTMDERDIIEAGFRKNTIRIIVATSTLSSGVNLPARRVIIRTPIFYGKPLDPLVYRQMVGRAGRMGRDSAGDSILICQKSDVCVGRELVTKDLRPIESCLEGSGRLKRAVLEVVASGVAVTPDDVQLFGGCSLLAAEGEDGVLANPIDDAVDFLCRNQFMRLQKLENGLLQYSSTPLGKACLSSSMPPEEGLALFAEVEKARECFVLETELHVIYLVTPYSICNQWTNLDWMLYLDLWEKLPSSMKRVGELVGIRESYIINSTRNKTQKSHQKLLVHKRFFTALALQDLVNEISISEVADKYGCNRGMLQSLQQSAATFAGMLTVFCRQLGWSTVEILVAQFQDRLQFGIQRDLLDLMRLPALNGQCARALFNNGIESVAQLAHSQVAVLENVLLKVGPFGSGNPLKSAKLLWVAGKEGLTEAELAVLLVQEARKFLQLELGLTDAKWDVPATCKHEETFASEASLFEDSLNEKPQSSNDSGLELLVVNEPRVETSSVDQIETAHDVIETLQLRNSPLNENVQTLCDSENIKLTRSLLGETSSLIDSFDHKATGTTVAIKTSQLQDSLNDSFDSPINKFRSKSKKVTETLLDDCLIDSTSDQKITLLSETDLFDSTKNKKAQVIPPDCKTDTLLGKTNPVIDFAFETSQVQENVTGIFLDQFDFTSTSCHSKQNLLDDIEPFDSATNSKVTEMIPQISSFDFKDNSFDTQNMQVTKIDSFDPLLDKITPLDSAKTQKHNTSSLDPFGCTLLNELSLLINQLDSANPKNKLTGTLQDTASPLDDSFDVQELVETSPTPHKIIETSQLESFASNKTIGLSGNKRKKPPNLTETPTKRHKITVYPNLTETLTKSSKTDVTSLAETPAKITPHLNLVETRVKSSKPYLNLVETPVKSSKPYLNLVETPVKSSKTYLNLSETPTKITANLNLQTPTKPTKIALNSTEAQIKSPKITGNSTPAKHLNIAYPNSASAKTIAENFTELQVVDVCANAHLFKTFSREICEQSTVAVSFACVSHNENVPIGNNIVKNNVQKQIQYSYKSRRVVGIAFSWGENVAYYLPLQDESSIIKNCSKIELVREVLRNAKVSVRMFDCKEQVKTGKLCCNVDFGAKAEDAKVADWLMEPEGKEKNLQALALKYAPETVSISQIVTCKGVGSVGLDLDSKDESRLRASAEAIVSWHACESANKILLEQSLALGETYKTEMSTVLLLAQMELNGIRVDNERLQQLHARFKRLSSSIESECYSLVGRRFSLGSSTEIAKALGIHKTRKTSTNKRALEQINKPLSALILQWRKINNTLTKIIHPLLTSVHNGFVHGYSVIHTATGRISMQEPNLQTVPRDFPVEIGGETIQLSCRDVFVAGEERTFLSADYCQLELRLLAHFSGDEILCEIMRSGEDVFKSVAAKWKDISEWQVDDTLRQRAKQLCYGIIYGIGTKTLSDQFEVTESEAAHFVATFHERYPKIRRFIENTVETCRSIGYVETLKGRRRYLPNITSENPTQRSQAERQAVNTTIQGSAADLAKSAMLSISSRFRDKFKHPQNLPKLVLHLHDEFVYEVQEKYLAKTANMLKKTMEEAVGLSVPFPVKVKSGKSWGMMTELRL